VPFHPPRRPETDLRPSGSHPAAVLCPSARFSFLALARALAGPVAIAGLAAGLVAGLAGGAAAEGPRDVRLMPSTGSSIRMVVDVPAPELEPVIALDGRSTGSMGRMRLAVAGYDATAPQGRPLLPERVLVVAVPPGGEVSVSASVLESEVTPDVRLTLAPVHVQRQKDEPVPGEGEALAELGDEAAGGVPTPGATPAGARLLDVGWMRNQRIARIVVNPASYDAASRRLSLARRIEIQVTVRGGAPAAAGLSSAPAEPHDPFERVYRNSLVNYAQGQAWRRTASSVHRRGGIAPLAIAAPGGAPGGIRATEVVPDTSVYAGRRWVKIAIDSTGFYSIRFGVLRGLGLFSGLTTVPIDKLRLFTWPGFPVLPEASYCDSCDYREVAMGFVEQAPVNGVFESSNDYLYFYALAASDWSSIYDPALPDTVFINHPYEKTNYYYLALASDSLPVAGTPLRIGNANGNPAQATGGETTPATFAERLHQEVDAQYWPNAWPNPRFHSNLFWEYWFWQNVEMGKPPFQPPALQAPGVDVTQPSQLRMRCWGVTDLGADKTFGFADHYLDVSINGRPFGRRAWNSLWAQTYDTTLVGLVQPVNTLSMAVPRIHDSNPVLDARRVDVTALAWYDLFYARRFEPVADALAFVSSPAGGGYVYHLGPFTLPNTAPPRVFDVTDPLAPVEILGARYDAGGLDFYRSETGRHRYRVLSDAHIKPLVGASVFMAPTSSDNNLRESPGRDASGAVLPGADYLILYYDGFQAAAESLRTWRAERLPLDGVSPPYVTAIVPISAVYDQFSGGRADPGAIRNFLRAAFFNWPRPPGFVTLFGDASYDFKNIGGYAPPGLPGTLLPAYEGGYVEGLQSQYATDDWMLNVDNAVTVIPDFFGGRIPAGDEASAMAFLRDKLLPYERSAPAGEWRNRVMLIADDNEQGSQPDGIGWGHLVQTAALDTAVTPEHIDRAYVYLHTYPDGPSDTKPGAKADIIKNVNDGVVMWNYIGHGSPFKIADENALLTSDVGSMHNAARPGLFIAASCDVGKFHDPSVQSLGELLLLDPAGGCLGVISATELAFSSENAQLNKTLYKVLFSRDTSATGTGQYHITAAEALLAAKTGSQNSQKYQLMGDAAMLLQLPRLWVEIALKDTSGIAVDTLRRGETVSFEGQVLDRPGGSLVGFNGSAGMLIEDSAPIDDTPPPCPTCAPYTYPFRAAPIFRGDARVSGGRFAGRFVVPLDAILGERARIRGYVDGDAPGVATATDGVGSDRFTLISGSTPPGDSEGPIIGLSFAGGSTAVRPDASLRIDLSDPHGILITGHTIQNGIIVTIDGNSTTRVDVTASFRYALNSFQAGTANFQLPNLATGHHKISVSAADNLASGINAAQHRSSAAIEFDVSPVPTLTVQRAFLFPNPTRSGGAGSGGTFVIDAPGDSVNVLLSLYTVTGRLIRTLKSFGGVGQVQIHWDGLDAEGDRLGNGTYLFRVQVNARDADGTSSAHSQAVAQGKVVVLTR
jgi:hypothetical protein